MHFEENSVTFPAQSQLTIYENEGGGISIRQSEVNGEVDLIMIELERVSFVMDAMNAVARNIRIRMENESVARISK